MKVLLKKSLSAAVAFSLIASFLCLFSFNIIKADAAGFTPRYSAPSTSDSRYYSSNPFYKGGYGMPNCTCYAYGRAWEILGSEPALSHGNAGKWYWDNKSSGKYSYGSTPKLGAIACWDKNDKNQGHVAVVEAINGSRVTLSESHYSGVLFDNKEMNADGSDYLKSFRFLGYIYIGDFSINRLPNGAVDSCSGGKGCVNVDGWCFDPDDVSAKLAVHIYLGTESDAGTCIGALTADGNRPDVNKAYGCGEYHGYSSTIMTDVAPGKYFLRAAFLDTAGGTATWKEGGWINIEPVDVSSTLQEVDLGDDFKAVIFSSIPWKPIGQSDNGNVELMTQKRENNKRILWHFIKDSDGTYSIWSYQTGTAICSNDASNVYCSKVTECISKFKIYKNGEDHYIKSVNTGAVFDLTNYNTNDGANIGFNSNIHSDASEKFSVCLLNATKNSLNYEITADKTAVNVNNKVTVTIGGKTDYAYEYIYYIKSPDGKTAKVNGGINYTYTFAPTQAGTYVVYAELKNPVTSEKGSETQAKKFVKINVTDPAATTAPPVTTVTSTSTFSSTLTTTTTVAATPELSIGVSEITLVNGEQYTIKANQSGLTYKSNNQDVAVVSKNGVITAVGEGNAVISIINADSDVVQLKVKVISALNGDANDDGSVTVADLVMLQKWLLGSNTELTNWQNADLCKDGVIDVFDLVALRRLLTEKTK